jgi:adenylate kinase
LFSLEVFIQNHSKSNFIKMLNLILFGPPGSGKGTQATKLIEKYNLLHISTGDLFRAEISNGTALGLEAKSYIDKGALVPDSVTVNMLKSKMEQHPTVEGVIFDGFPRTIPQSEALDEMLKSKGTEVSLLLSLVVDDAEIIRRIAKRGESSGRTDDTDPEIIQNRINTYKSQTTPVADYYSKFGKTKTVAGVGSVDEIFENLCAEIDSVTVK